MRAQGDDFLWEVGEASEWIQMLSLHQVEEAGGSGTLSTVCSICGAQRAEGVGEGWREAQKPSLGKVGWALIPCFLGKFEGQEGLG